MPGAWLGLGHTFTGSNGVTLDLGEQAAAYSPNSAVILVDASVVGMGSPRYEVQRSAAPALAGTRYRGTRVLERPVELSFVVMDDTSSLGFFSVDQWLWDIIGDPSKPVVWRVTNPITGTWRELTIRFEEDASGGYTRDPLYDGWTLYQLRFVADDPYWYGETEELTFLPEESSDFFIVDPDHGANMIENSSFETAVSPWTTFANTSVTRTDGFPAMVGRVGSWIGQATATADAAQIGFNSESIAIDPTKWYGYQFWCAADTTLPAGTVVRAQMRLPADGTAVFPFTDHPADSGQFAFYAGGFARQVIRPQDVAPGVTTMRLQPNLDALNPALIPSGKRFWMDQVILVVGESEAEVNALLDEGYQASTADDMFFISQSLTTADVEIPNPGEVAAWIKWTAQGEMNNLDLVTTSPGQTDGSLGIPDVLAGDVLVLDSDPRVATARLDGVDITEQVNPWDPRPIPPGETQRLIVSTVITGDGFLRAEVRPRYRRAY